MLHSHDGDGRPPPSHEHEEHRTVTEPVERLEQIPLNDSKPDRTTRIGTLTSPTVRQALITFLKDNRDVFA